jgi:hypothetical protein
MKTASSALIFAFALLITTLTHAVENPFVGRWAVTTPGGDAGWIGVENIDGKLSASVMWGSGSVVPAEESSIKDGTLTIKRLIQRKGSSTSHIITAVLVGRDDLTLTSTLFEEGGTEKSKDQCTARRLPPLPRRPDLSKVVFGEPISLIPASGLSGWQLTKKDATNGWSVTDGVLSNRVGEVKSTRHGNLRTDATYEDFQLTTEVRTLPNSNSGIYLRGVYEIQISESFGKPLDSHNMGALYSRITPAVSAEKPVGEWQTLEITLVDHHITVVLNGKTLIDNQPALGCTGGALTSDDSQPGPIMLQGDHTSIDYRNMVLRPVK